MADSEEMVLLDDEDRPIQAAPASPDVPWEQMGAEQRANAIETAIRDRLRATVGSATLGYLPKFLALSGERPEGVPSTGKTISEDQEQALPEWRAAYEKAEAEHPGYALAGSLMTPIPGLGKLKGLARLGGMMGIGAGLGGLRAMAKDEGGMNILESAGTSALGAGMFGTALEKFVGGISGVGSRLGEKFTAATEKAREKAAEPLLEEVASAGAAMGPKNAAVTREAERLRQILMTGTQEEQAMARTLSESPEGIAARKLDLEIRSRELPRVTGEKEAADKAFAEIKAGLNEKAQTNFDKQLQGYLENTYGRAIKPRVQRYAARTLVPIATTGIGGALGGVPGAIGGALAGSAMGAALGAPGTALANMLKDPGVQAKYIYGPLSGMVSGAGSVGQKLSPLAIKSGSQTVKPVSQAAVNFIKKMRGEETEPSASMLKKPLEEYQMEMIEE